MNEESLLDSYVEQMRGAGVLDSEGVFTVASDRALGVLSQFILPNPGDWLLKMVQAACAAEATEIKIKQTRAATQVRFQFSGPLDLTQFENGFTTQSAAASVALSHLYTGLRAVSGEQGRDWVVRVVCGGEESLLQCSQGQLVARRQSNRESLNQTDIHLAVAYPKGEFGKLGGLIRFGESIQEEHLALLTRARACPIPITLDGVRLDDLQDYALHSALQQRLYLGLLHTAGNTSSSHNLPIGRSVFEPSPRERGERVPCYLQDNPPFGAFASIQRWYYNYTVVKEISKSGGVHQKVPAASRFLLIRDGVEVASRTLNLHHPVSVDVILSGQGLKTDLTGLKVEPGPQEEELARNTVKTSLEGYQKMLGAVSNYKPYPARRSLWLYGGLGALGLLAPPLAVKAVLGTASVYLLNQASSARRDVVKAAVESMKDFENQVWHQRAARG